MHPDNQLSIERYRRHAAGYDASAQRTMALRLRTIALLQLLTLACLWQVGQLAALAPPFNASLLLAALLFMHQLWCCRQRQRFTLIRHNQQQFFAVAQCKRPGCLRRFYLSQCGFGQRQFMSAVYFTAQHCLCLRQLFRAAYRWW